MSDAAKATLRASAVAGRFFPAEAARLAEAVGEGLKTAPPAMPDGPVAVISPHAGYRFSGHLTAAALAQLGPGRPDRVVILSPSHAHRFTGLALPRAAGYSLPGFDLSIDTVAGGSLLRAGLAQVEDSAHDREHGIETQLPFLHRLHPGVPVVPLVLGRSTDDDVALAVDHLAGLTGKTAFVLSSDLSHFLSLTEAQALDQATAKLIETGCHDSLSASHACGMRAIRGFMASQAGAGLRARRLGMANSHRATGDPARTVGYGAWGLYHQTADILPGSARAELMRVARATLASYLSKGRMPEIRTASFAPALQTHAAAFVTLTQNGRLRGCIGSLKAHQPLVRDVADNAVKAASRDPRFPQLTAEELAGVTLKVAVLSPAQRLACASQSELETVLVPGRDGLILSDAGRRGTFLPMVWDEIDRPRNFVQALKRKAGLPPDHWSDTLRIERFCAEGFAETG